MIDLFCGAGGLSLGFEGLDSKKPTGVDIDWYAVKTYCTNVGLAILSDIRKLSPHDPLFSGHDILLGGVPCQTFSLEGRAKIRALGRDPKKDSRSYLYREFLRFVRALKPKVFVMENVKAARNFLIPRMEREVPTEYSLTCAILDASKYGVPQKRERLFIVGVRGGDFDFPHGKGRILPFSEAVSDLPPLKAGDGMFEMAYLTEPQNAYQSLIRENSPKLFNHVTRKHNTRDLFLFSLIPPGGNYLSVPKKFRHRRDDAFIDRYYKIHPEKPCKTLTAHMSKDTRSYIFPVPSHEPALQRTISVREAARVQSFPDWFVFPAKITHAFRLIGNAVPPILARTIALAIKEQVM